MYGLIGYPLSHSFSRDFFTKKFDNEQIRDTDYRNFPLADISEFPGLLDSVPKLRGLNVTIPYKEKILPFLDELDPVAAEIGAVNTIKFDYSNGKRVLIGYNTDAYGFKRSLEELISPEKKINKALILGTGGASKAVAYTLKQLSISFEFVSSSDKSKFSYQDINRKVLNETELIINTSPLGMYPNVSEYPLIPYDCLTSQHILFDLIYNPALTLFLQKGKEQDATISNGLKMLEYQAIKAWEIWNSRPESHLI